MVSCLAELCSHKSSRNKCSFFRFPREPEQQVLWMKVSRKADKTHINDRRLCSCHFKDGKKENGPTMLFYYNKEILVNLVNSEEIPSPEEGSCINDEKKLRKRKEMDTEACSHHNDNCTANNVKHKKYKRRFKENISDTKTSVNKDVNKVNVTDEICTSSSDTLERNSNSVKIPLIPIKLGNSTIYKNTSTTITSVKNTYLKYHIQPKVPFPSDFFSSAITNEETLSTTNSSEEDSLESTISEASTPLSQASAPLSTNKKESSASKNKQAIMLESEETFSDNYQNLLEELDVDELEFMYIENNELEHFPPICQIALVQSGETFSDNWQSIQEKNVHELDDLPLKFNKMANSSSAHQPITRAKSKEMFSDNLQGEQKENNVHELDLNVMRSRPINSVSESNIASVSEQITTVTHADAFCATQTLLHYMMNLDDVKISDINFILNLAKKIKKKNSIEEEIIPEIV